MLVLIEKLNGLAKQVEHEAAKETGNARSRLIIKRSIRSRSCVRIMSLQVSSLFPTTAS